MVIDSFFARQSLQFFPAANNGSIDISIGGTVTAGDTVTLSATNPGVASPINVTYTVTSSDSLISIASNIASLINSNSILQNIEISASNMNTGNLLWSESFQTTPVLSGGKNQVAITGQDGGGSQKTNKFPLSTKSNSSQSLTYDLNSNVTNDGTNTYQWDAENRLIQINYPGSGNYSQLTYNGENHLVRIVETSSGTVTSTKQFVWSKETMQEARDVTGALTAQYLQYGCVSGGTNFFYAKDMLGSIGELTNSSGSISAEYTYDPFGNSVKIQGSSSSDFQYAGYYFHSPSRLNIATYRTYSSNLGRWTKRDPILETGGVNLYAYVQNDPVVFKDAAGLYCQCFDDTCCENNVEQCKAKGGDLECCLDAGVGCHNDVQKFGKAGTAGFYHCTRKRKSPYVAGQPGSGTAWGPFMDWMTIGGVIIFILITKNPGAGWAM